MNSWKVPFIEENIAFAVTLDASTDWHRLPVHAVGGLTGVGFSSDEAHLLVVSHDGRGLVSTSTGERVARDRTPPTTDSDWLRDGWRQVRGIGPTSDEWFDVVGLWGGLLPQRCESTGWSVRHDTRVAFLEHATRGAQLVVDEIFSEFQALGMSPSGRIVVLATSSDLTILVQRHP